MRWMICVVFVLSACGSVDGSSDGPGGSDAASTGVDCPTEDVMVTGGPSNPICRLTDLYLNTADTDGHVTSMMSTLILGDPAKCEASSAGSNCASVHVVADGKVSADGKCSYAATYIWAVTSDGCQSKQVIVGTVDYAALQARAK